MGSYSVGLGNRLQVINNNEDSDVDPKAGIVLIDASKEHITARLPPAQSLRYNTIALVAEDVTLGIDLVLEEGDTWLDDSNVGLNTKGDAITLVSNRENQWICISRYTGHLAY